MFQLTEFLPIVVASVSLPAKKKGTEIIHTTDITVVSEGANSLLNLFDPKLLDQWYRAVESDEDNPEPELAGVESVSEKPVLRTTSVKMPLQLTQEYAGYTLIIDRGTGGKTHDIEVGEVTIKSIRVWMKEGGSVKMSMHLQSKDVSSAQVGQLRDFQKRETKLKLIAPKIQQDIDRENQMRAAAEPRRGRRAANGAPAAGQGATASAQTAKPKKPTKADNARAATDEWNRLHEQEQAQQRGAAGGGDGAPAAH